jgi:peroxiredoxin
MKKNGLLLFVLLILNGLAAAGPIKNLQEMKEREKAPAFALANLDGKKVQLSDFRGRIVFLNFWASWCAPCREEMPGMEKLFRDLKGQDFVILGVNVKENREKAQKFAQELKITFPLLLDPQGEVGLLYGAWGLPTTYIIGKKGEVIARAFGPAVWDSKESYEYFRSLFQKQT